MVSPLVLAFTIGEEKKLLLTHFYKKTQRGTTLRRETGVSALDKPLIKQEKKEKREVTEPQVEHQVPVDEELPEEYDDIPIFDGHKAHVHISRVGAKILHLI